MSKKPDVRAGSTRNNAFFDMWSVVHVVVGIGLGWTMDPFVALLIMVIHEPFEVFILSPLLARFGIVYGYESLRNSLSDIMFDALGVAIGVWIVTALWGPPFHLF